jgi:hypothetical protein
MLEDDEVRGVSRLGPKRLASLTSGPISETWWVPAGAAHDVLSLLALGALVCSLAWVGENPRVIRARRERRAFEQGRCARCGYSLAGIDLPVCPECGNSLTPTMG